MSTKTQDTVAEVPDEKQPDLEVIVPEPGRVVIDGIDCQIRRLKTREFLLLMRVITKGLGSGLSAVSIDFTDEESVGRDLAALMVLALPNAFEEFVEFLQAIVEPVDPRKNAALAKAIGDNPDVDVLLDVFEVMAVQEKDDLAALAGKAQAMWSRVVQVYRPK